MEEDAGASCTSWTPSATAALIAGVRAYLLQGRKNVAWNLVWQNVRDRLPGRTLGAAQQQWGKRLSRGIAAASGEGGKHLSDSSVWTPEELAALAAAVHASTRVVGAHTIDWAYVSAHAPALTGRTLSAIGKHWRTAVGATPAAKAMLAEVAEVVASQGAGTAAGAAGAAGAAAAPLPPPPVTPFHMLHSLRSSGCLDEATLSVCWRGTVAAMKG